VVPFPFSGTVVGREGRKGEGGKRVVIDRAVTGRKDGRKKGRKEGRKVTD
jgi:hypothetical protein